MEVVLKFWRVERKTLTSLHHRLTKVHRNDTEIKQWVEITNTRFSVSQALGCTQQKGPYFQLAATFTQPLIISQWSGAPTLMVRHVSLHHTTTSEIFSDLLPLPRAPSEPCVPPPPPPSCSGRSGGDKSLPLARLPRRFKSPLFNCVLARS